MSALPQGRRNISSNQRDSLDAANNPTASNAVATINDILLMPFTDKFNRPGNLLRNGWLYSDGIWSLNGHAPICIPTLDSDLVLNGDMETGDPPDNWSASNANLAANTVDPISGTQDLQVTALVANGSARQYMTLNTNKWYRVFLRGALISGAGYRVYFEETNPTRYIYDTGGMSGSARLRGSWYSQTSAARLRMTASLANDVVRFDDVSIFELITSDLFAVRETGVENVIAKVNVGAATAYDRLVGGIALNVDSQSNPQNYVLGLVHATNKASLIKCVNGVISDVIPATTVTYVANHPIEVRKSGTTYSLWYDDIQVGTDQTISDASIINNTLHGMFSTDSEVILTQFSLRSFNQPIPVGKSGVAIVFDDGNITDYTIAYDYMKTKGLAGTSYIVSDNIGISDHLTSANLQEMDTSGWDIGNHTKSHADLSALSQAEIETELKTCQNVLDGLGLTRASRHVAYPIGRYNNTVRAAMAASGMITGRATTLGNIDLKALPLYDINCFHSSTVVATIQGWITDAVAANRIAMLLFHGINTGGITTASFQALCDWIAAQGYDSYTISDLYNLSQKD